MTATPQYGSDLVVDLFRVVGIAARGDQYRRKGPTHRRLLVVLLGIVYSGGAVGMGL